MGDRNRELTPEGFAAIARRFKILSDPVRLRILHALRAGDTSVGELAELTGTSQPNVSKHLSLLRAEGLVERSREGGRVHYRVADPHVFELCETVCSGLEEGQAERVRLFV